MTARTGSGASAGAQAVERVRRGLDYEADGPLTEQRDDAITALDALAAAIERTERIEGAARSLVGHLSLREPMQFKEQAGCDAWNGLLDALAPPPAEADAEGGAG